MVHAANRKLGVVVGILVGIAIVGVPLFDDLRSWIFSPEWLREAGMIEDHDRGIFIPEIETMLYGGLALILGIASGIGIARGTNVTKRVLVGGGVAILVIVTTTLDRADFPGDATPLRMLALPAAAVGCAAVAMALALRHAGTLKKPTLA